MLHHLLHCDAVLFLCINSRHAPGIDLFFMVVTWLGEGWVAVPLAAAALIAAAPRPLLAKMLLVAVIAGALTGVCNTQIKRIVNRPRPSAFFASEGRPRAVRVLGERLEQDSFPSGHTATAFAAAAIVFLFLKKKHFGVFIPAVFVAYSRVYVGAHFPLDVAGGAMVGCCIPVFVITLFRRWLFSPLPAAQEHVHDQ
jgi:membrane-associated phospholipid phosphatase